MNIYLIRHGESIANVDPDVYNKIPDHRIPMTEKGKLQAEEVGKKLAKQIESANFFVSPYVRAMETYDIIKNHVNADTITYSPALREQEYEILGDLAYRKKVLTERDLYGKFFYKFKNGESIADVYDRVLSFYNFLLHSYPKSAKVVIVAHEVVIRCFLMIIDSRHPEDSFMQIENAKIIAREV